MDVIQSIINVLYDPQASLEPSEFIELIHERTNLSIDDATREYKKWSEKKSIDSDKKSYSIQTKETGSEIIINKYLDEYIRFQIYNVQSLDELNRIISFIKIFMKLYSLFVSDKLNASLKQLFMKNNAKKNIIDLQDNLQAIELVDHSQEEESSGDTSDSGSINIDDISDASSSSGGGSSSDSSSEKERFKINQGKDSWSYLNSLKNADKDLYKPNKKVEYSKRCTNNEGSRMPIPVSDRKLEQIDKNDILLTATKLNSKNEEVPLTYSERKQYMALPLDKMISKLNSDNINYKEGLKSYSSILSQGRIDDDTNINYICPKYWDISRKLPVHPRDIHKYLDNIVSLNFRGETDKFIIDRQGNTKTHDFWKEISNDNLKQDIVSKIRTSDEEKKKLLDLDINDFYKEIYSGKYNITKEDLDDIYQTYVNRLAPGFINEKYNVDGYRLPCCFKNKGDKPVITQKKADTNKILLSNLTPCNINLFGHVHVKLQKLFNHDETLQDNPLGGFIKYGVKQNNNSLIYAFANLDDNYKNTLEKADVTVLEQRIIRNYTNPPYTMSIKDVKQTISDIKKEGKDIYLK